MDKEETEIKNIYVYVLRSFNWLLENMFKNVN